MATFPELFPDPNDLLAMPVEDVAPILLRLAKDRIQNGMVNLIGATDVPLSQAQHYSPLIKHRIDAHLSACWDWLRQQGLLAPAPGINGTNGWMMLTQKGEQIGSAQDLIRLQSAMAFPKELLHPAIRDKVWKAFARGDLDDAVFAAFKAVEIAVRQAGGYAATDIGVPLMRKAFDKATGPLSDMSQPDAERDALAHLFAGAIGSYKNPHSHRTVALTDLREAQEQTLLASHLLSIVDSRKP